MLASKLAGVPNRLHTIAGLPLMESSGIKMHILNMVEKITYSCATKIYPNSNGLYSYILKKNSQIHLNLKLLGKEVLTE